MTFFVISVLTLNIILWLVFLIRFKKLFNTDDIVNKTQKKIEHLVREIDNAADRDTYLARESTKRIQKLLDDADVKMGLFKEATQRLRDMIAEADKVNRGQVIKTKITTPEQQSLFDNNYTESPKKNLTPSPSPSPEQEAPLIITKVYDDKPKKMTPEEIRKNLNSIVIKKFNEGQSADEIAANLNCSITEVQFIIDMM